MSESPYLEEFKAFRGTVPLQKVSIGKVSQKMWCFYDFGPKTATPLICLPGIAGSAAVFFRLIEQLAAKGHRVISVQHAPYMSFASLLKGLDLFIDRLKIGKCHMLGEGFGGYVVQTYAQYRPAKVASLVLCNSYCDMQHFVDSSPFTGFLSWMPDVLMKRFLVSDLRYKGPVLDQVTAYKFVSYHSKKFDTDDLCSRLTLQYMQGPLKPKDFPVPDEVITIIDTADPIAFPDRIRLEVHKFYPSAKEVTLATGGTFPFLSAPVEFANAVDTHIQANSKNLLFSPDVATSADPNAPSSSNTTPISSANKSSPSSSSAPQGTSPSSYNGEGPQHPSNHVHKQNGASNGHASHPQTSPTKPKSATAAKQVAAKKPVEEEEEVSSSVSSSSSSSSSSA